MSSIISIPTGLLVLLEPNWDELVKTRYSLESHASEGRTGIQTRTPLFLAPRIRQTYTLLLTDAEYDELRLALADLKGKRLTVPIWPDAYRDRSEWIHQSDQFVAWDEAGYELLPSTGSSTKEFMAPVMTGLIKARPSVIRYASDAWGVQFDIEEDCAWASRIQISSGFVPGSFIWEPEADTIKDLSRDQIVLTKLGASRVSGIAGDSGRARWGQEATVALSEENEFGEFLRFWFSVQGSVKSFTAPTWSQPGDDRESTPANYQATFEKDMIELTWITSRLATAQVRMWQELPSASAQNSLATSYGYAFWHEDESDHLYFTSWEHAIVDGDLVYQPTNIGHTGLRLTLKPLGDEVQIEMHQAESMNPLLPIFQGDAERKLWCSITKFGIDDTGLVIRADELFTGLVRNVELKDEKLVGNAAAWGGSFGRHIPRFLEQKGCNYHFCDDCCTLAKEDWLFPGSIAAGDAATASVLFTPDTAIPSGEFSDKWFAKGWLQVMAADGVTHKRAVLDCTGSTGAWTLHLNRDLPANCLGRRAAAFTGCDLRFATCKGKFSNSINFGGCPTMTNFISTSNGVTSTKAK